MLIRMKINILIKLVICKHCLMGSLFRFPSTQEIRILVKRENISTSHTYLVWKGEKFIFIG